jgi:hypothetical protein
MMMPAMGIAFDELCGTVHRSVELRFPLDIFSALLRFLLIDDARAQIGVDGHLFARHGIQRKASRHFGNAFRTLCDYDELYDKDDHKDDETYDGIAAEHERSKRLDHFACLPLVREDEPRRGDVQRQPQKRRNEEQGREDRKFQRPPDEHRDEQDGQRNRDAHDEHKVEDERRQRYDDETDDHHHEQDDDIFNCAHALLLSLRCL